MEWKNNLLKGIKSCGVYLEVSNINNNKFAVARNLYLCAVRVQDREMINIMFDGVQMA